MEMLGGRKGKGEMLQLQTQKQSKAFCLGIALGSITICDVKTMYRVIIQRRL